MTCIIGVEHQGKVVVAGDSGAWSTNENDVMRMQAKVAKLKSGAVVGFAGSVGLSQRWVAILAVLTEVTPGSIRDTIKAAYDRHSDDDDSFSAVLGVGDTLYSVCSDGSVIRPVDGVATAGSAGYARGFFEAYGKFVANAYKDPKGVRTALQLALKCQATHSSSCVPPFVVRST